MKYQNDHWISFGDDITMFLRACHPDFEKMLLVDAHHDGSRSDSDLDHEEELKINIRFRDS